MRISFGILVHNETDSLQKLLDSLLKHRDYEYEVVIIDDYSDNQGTAGILGYHQAERGVKVYQRHLDNDYASQKNFMIEKCIGDYILNPDADEIFPDYLLENIHLIIEQNNTECLWLPRVNIVEGLTPEWAQRFGFRVNEKGWVNWPDPQQRVFKKDYPRICWINKVHERLTGYKNHAFLPFEMDMTEYVAIKHVKTLWRQIEQNQKYSKILEEIK